MYTHHVACRRGLYKLFYTHTELYALLLTDVLVLAERHEERDKFYLRCYTVEGLGGVKEELSPVIRLKDCLLRSAAADKGPSRNLLWTYRFAKF